jgi:hypothetical protein
MFESRKTYFQRTNMEYDDSGIVECPVTSCKYTCLVQIIVRVHNYTDTALLFISFICTQSQFCLNDVLWDSGIGDAALSLSGFDEWKHFSSKPGRNDDSATDFQAGGRVRKIPRAIEKKMEEWIKGSDKPLLQRFVAIPAREMQALWEQSIASIPDEEGRVRASEDMNRLHEATRQLRACYTDLAVEKASIQVTLALLDVAAQQSCHNPFLCLQQAAIFASQGSKAGNNDEVFRKSVPEANVCTPLEALIILGRADCLHSIYFPNEAAFLCSYASRVCSLHRDRQRPELEWNARWKIVAIVAYNISCMIRNTVSSVLDKDMQRSFLDMWERDVIEELERGRTDALSWKRNLNRLANEGPVVIQGQDDAENVADASDEEFMEVENEAEGEEDKDAESGDDEKIDSDEDERVAGDPLSPSEGLDSLTYDNGSGMVAVTKQESDEGSTEEIVAIEV